MKFQRNSVQPQKLSLLRALPTSYEGDLVLQQKCTFGLPFLSTEAVHASVRSGFLILRKVGVKRKTLVRFIPLAHSKISPSRKPNTFTVSTAGVSISLKTKDPVEFEHWVSELNAEARKFEKTINLKDFVVVDTFGRGHFGEVNIILHKASKQIFALKSMSMNGSENSLNIFERANLERVNILKDSENVHSLPRLFFAFSRQDFLFLVTEAYLGGNLLQLIRTFGQLEEKTVLFITVEVCLALLSLHSIFIAHRDIKPENICLTAFGHVKLIDFGLSKDFSSNKLTSKVKAEGKEEEEKEEKKIVNSFYNKEIFKSYEMLGTTYYQPPEMLKGFGHNLSIDFWQLGCLIFELLFGRPVFIGRTAPEIENQIVSSEEIRIKSQNKYGELSSEVIDFIESLLIREPSDRLGFKDNKQEIFSHLWFTTNKIDLNSFETQDEEFEKNIPKVLIPSKESLEKYNFDSLTKSDLNNSEKFEDLESHIDKLYGSTSVSSQELSSKKNSSEDNLKNLTSSKTSDKSQKRKILDKLIKKSSFHGLNMLKHQRQSKKLSDKDLSRLGIEYTYQKKQINHHSF